MLLILFRGGTVENPVYGPVCVVDGAIVCPGVVDGNVECSGVVDAVTVCPGAVDKAVECDC